MNTYSPVGAMVDIAVVALIVFGIVNGIRRGLTSQVSGFLCVTIASIVAIYSYDTWVPYVERYVTGERQSAIAFSFIAMVGVGWLLMLLLRTALRRVTNISVDQKFDRAGGGLAGFLSSTILVVLVFLIMGVWPNRTINSIFRDQSRMGRAVIKCLPMLNDKFDHLLLDPSIRGRRVLKRSSAGEGR